MLRVKRTKKRNSNYNTPKTENSNSEILKKLNEIQNDINKVKVDTEKIFSYLENNISEKERTPRNSVLNAKYGSP